MNTQTSRPRWRGYFPALVTPFNRDLSLDLKGLEDLIAWLVSENMHGFVVAGTTGEWTALSFEERCKLFDTSRRCLSDKSRPLIAGCSALRIEESLSYIQVAADLAMDGVLLTVPPYVCPTEEESLEFFRQVAGQSDLPIIAYNWPQGTGVDFSLALVRELAKIDNIVAIKNSTPNRALFLEILQSAGQEIPIFGIMPGEVGLETMRQWGGVGCIGATGVLGHKQPGFFEAVWAGDWERAKVLGSYDERLMRTFFDGFKGRFGHAIPTFKYLLELQGLPGGPVRAPLLTLSEASRRKISDLVREMALFEHI